MRAILIALCLLGSLASTAGAQDIGRVVIASGTRTNGVVRIVVRDHLRQIRACLRGRNLYVVSLRLEIDPAGAVTSARATPTELGRSRLDCIEAEARTWTFPASDEATRARVEVGFIGGGMPVPGPSMVRLGNVRLVPPTPEGPLEREVLRRWILRSGVAIRACYEYARSANPEITGEVTLQITIAATGSVSDARLVSTTFPEGVVTPACLATRIRQITFPAADGETRFTQIFRFSPPG